METYDLVVIGAGAAGLVASGFAGRLGLKVALIEKELLGGDCTHYGCVPSKALLMVARKVHAARNSAKYGVHVDNVRVDMAQVREYVQGTVREIYRHETPEVFAREYGVEVITGEARFINADTVIVNGREFHAKRIIIATGARPLTPPIKGLDDVPYMTYKTIFDNDTLPDHLIVIGAGPIGAEMAQAHARFGAKVTMIDTQLLPRDEPEVAEVVERIFADEEITIVKSLAESVRQDGNEVVVTTQSGDEVRGDRLLVVTGRVPVVDTLDLDKAGVNYSEKGIDVDKYLRTNVQNIYAIGDCIGMAQFTHKSGNQGSIAARNALLPVNTVGINEKTLPWVTYIEPEVAHVGLTEQQARDEHGDNVKVHRFDLKDGDRSLCEDDTEGFIKIVYKGGKVLGATIVADRAGEMITEFTMAMDNNISLRGMIGSMHAYPSYSDLVYSAVADAVIDGLLDGFTGKLIGQAKRILPL